MGRNSRSEPGARRRRRAPVVALAAIAAIAGSGGGLATGDRAIARTGLSHTDVVTVSSKPLGNAVPGAFVGISLEYGTVASAELPGRGGADPVLARLIRNLSPGYAPVIRIGGESGDKTWWPVPGIRRPRGVDYALTPAWLADARQLTKSAHARLILGINLEADSTSIAATEADHLLAGIGRRNIEALEIGNEPELYAGIPWYVTRAGQKGFGRPPTYSLANYMKDFATIAAALPPVPLAGPSTGADAWIAGLGQLLAANPTLRLATFHAYALDPRGDAFRGHDCSTAIGEPGHPSVSALLNSYASQTLVQGALPYIAIAHSHGIPFRIDEMNAITCAGARGRQQYVGIRAMGARRAVSTGARRRRRREHSHVARVRRQAVRHALPARPVGGHGRARVLRDADVRPGSSSGLPTSVDGAGRRRSAALVGGAGAGSQRSRRPDQRQPEAHALGTGTATRAEPRRDRWRASRRLVPTRGPGSRSAGQSFSPRTVTGRLAGPARLTIMRPSAGGYLVRLPPASAALLTIR